MSQQKFNKDTHQRAHRRVKARLGFMIHLSIYIGVNTMLAVIAWQADKTWNLYPLLGWGLGLAIHGLGVLVGPSLYDTMLARELKREAQDDV